MYVYISRSRPPPASYPIGIAVCGDSGVDVLVGCPVVITTVVQSFPGILKRSELSLEKPRMKTVSFPNVRDSRFCDRVNLP